MPNPATNIPDARTREKEIFEQAIDLAAGAARLAFVAEACRDDTALRARVETLLRLHEEDVDLFLPEAPRISDLTERAGAVIDRYTLLEKIGEGGFGVVYMAEQEQPVRRRVALKIIKLGMDTREVVARFEAERQALALMDHSNIARVLDGGATETGRPYFVMELVKGVPITKYCDERQLSIRARLELFIAVCEAVQHAHQKGVIHRDLKPSNVLVTEIDGRAVPKVIDFGVARATAARLTERTLFTKFHEFIGTPAYMSPEQAGLGKLDIDTRSDIYALGVLLYELLTGHTPFDMKALLAEGYDAILRTIREVEPPKPSTRLRTLSHEQLSALRGRREEEPKRLSAHLAGDLDWIVMRCIEKERTRRYETATSLAQDLQRHLQDEPVTARPPSAVYRLRKLVRRHRLACAAAALVLAALIGGLAIASWSLGREREARLHARRLLYAADMNLAQQSLKANNLARARVLLDRHRPAKPTDVDLRGWEWRYLWQQTRSGALAELTRHSYPAYSTGFSRDGKLFAIGYQDGRVELWDSRARQRQRVLIESGSAPGCVAFAPDADALAFTVGAGVIEWCDLRTGESAVRARVNSQVRDMAFSRDGSRLVVTCVGAPSLHIIESSTGNVLASEPFRTSHSDWFDSARLSPDGERIYLTLLHEGRPTLECYRLADWEELWFADLGKREGATALELSPDGRFVVTATGYESDPIRVWDALTGKPVATLEGHTKYVARLAFSADGRVLMSSSSDQTVRMWETETWRETRLLRGHLEEVFTAALSPDGRFVVSGSEDGTVLFWDVTQAPVTGRTMLPAHVKSVWALPGGGAVLAMTSDRAYSVIDLATLRETPLLFGPKERLFFVPPNVFGEYDGREQVKVTEVLAHDTKPLGIVNVGPKFEGGFAYHAGKRLFAWGDGSRTLHVVPLDQPMARIDLAANVEPVRPLNFSVDGRVLRGSWTRRVGVTWNLETRQLLPASDAGWLAADSRTDEIGTRNRAVLPFDQMGRLRSLTIPWQRFRDRADVGGLTNVDLSNDGRLLAVGSETGFLAIFDYANLANFSILAGSMQDVDGVAFSPDSRRLATSSHGDEMVKLWDMETRQELLTLPGTGSEIYAIEFTDNGNTILAGRAACFGRDISGLCQFWTAPSWGEIAAAESSRGR